MQTRTAAVQRRRSTFSFRNILPAIALVTNVSEADAGATRLRLRWFSASRREKKASARKLTPAKKSGQVMTARIAPLRAEWARMSSRWRPRSWWAKQRQELSSCLLLPRHLLNRNGGQFGRRHGSFRKRRAVRHKPYSHGDEYDPCPALKRDCFVQPEAREQCHDHVAECCGREHEAEIGPRKGSEIAGEE